MPLEGRTQFGFVTTDSLSPAVTTAPNEVTLVAMNRTRAPEFGRWLNDSNTNMVPVMDGRIGGVIWLTGLPGAGKSTIATLVAELLRRQGADALVIDGDEVRATISRGLGFSLADRDENVRRVAELADRHAANGRLVIVALISPLRRHRELARKTVAGRFLEVFVDASLDECVRRDPKGLYARALAGRLDAFTGVSSPYERPDAPDLAVDTQTPTPDESARIALDFIACRWGIPDREA